MSGLYNALFGEQPASAALMKMLNLTAADVGRYRDCYLAEGPKIVVFTRNGGGNREDYRDVTIALRKHPQYVYDYDDDFDCTYASYEFNVPEEYREVAEAILAEAGPATPPMEKFKALIDGLRSKV